MTRLSVVHPANSSPTVVALPLSAGRAANSAAGRGARGGGCTALLRRSAGNGCDSGSAQVKTRHARARQARLPRISPPRCGIALSRNSWPSAELYWSGEARASSRSRPRGYPPSRRPHRCQNPGGSAGLPDLPTYPPYMEGGKAHRCCYWCCAGFPTSHFWVGGHSRPASLHT